MLYDNLILVFQFCYLRFRKLVFIYIWLNLILRDMTFQLVTLVGRLRLVDWRSLNREVRG